MRARGMLAARARARAVVGIVVVVAACRPGAASQPPHAGDGGEPAPTAEPAPTEPPVPCGPVGERFDDHAWAPASATTIAAIALDAPELPAALQALAEHARAPGHGLPIPLSFSLGQWSWQVPVLVATLREAGFAPAELVFVSTDANDSAWVWHSSCDLDEAVARIEATWAVEARRTVEGVIATPRPPAGDGTPAFPYDVLILPGQRMAMAPAGRGGAVLGSFGRAAPPGLSGAPPTTAGRRLDALAPAPVRLVVLGRALLDPGAAAADHAAQVLRITGDGVERPTTTADPEPAGRTGDASLPPP